MRVLFRTFGCKANQYDTERMRQELEALGAVQVSDPGQAQFCVVNTCTVTNQADADARRFIRRVRRENPEIEVVAAGCSTALNPETYQAMAGVVAVVEGHDPVEVAKATVSGLEGGGCHPAGASTDGRRLIQIQDKVPLEAMDREPVGGQLLRRRAGSTRGWLKIQDGCDRKCSFCATRLARGDSRSRIPEDLVAEAKGLSSVHPELVLTGIHIGHYGRDLEEMSTLSSLVALLLDQVPNVRFRLGSVEATEVDDVLLELLESSGGRLVPHLHMPLQSGSDSVLKGMRRWHTREMYRSRTLEIAERVERLGLGADVIAGFPGETERDHALTRSLVEELPFTYLHVFPFSPRNGTPASEMPGPVPQRIAGERARDLRELAHEKGVRYRQGRVGESAQVVLEGDGGWALTEDYLRVAVTAPVPSPRGGRPEVHSGTLGGDGENLNIELPQEKLN